MFFFFLPCFQPRIFKCCINLLSFSFLPDHRNRLYRNWHRVFRALGRGWQVNAWVPQEAAPVSAGEIAERVRAEKNMNSGETPRGRALAFLPALSFMKVLIDSNGMIVNQLVPWPPTLVLGLWNAPTSSFSQGEKERANRGSTLSALSMEPAYRSPQHHPQSPTTSCELKSPQ